MSKAHLSIKETIKQMSRKKKIAIAVTVIFSCCLIAGGVFFFIAFQKKTSARENDRNMPEMPGGQNMVTAQGTTTVGMILEEFELDDLDTELYVDEVYLSQGDQVEKGAAIFKISDDSLQKAKKELERAARSAEYAYDQQQITAKDSELQAKAEYDKSELERKYAELAYEDALRDSAKEIEELKTQIADTQELITEYTSAVENNYYYTYYDVENKKQQVSENFELLMKLYKEWNIEEISKTSTTGSTTSGSAGSITGTASGGTSAGGAQAAGAGTGTQGTVTSLPTTAYGKAAYLKGYLEGYEYAYNGNTGTQSTDTEVAARFETWLATDTNYALVDETAADLTGVDADKKAAALTAYQKAFSDGRSSGMNALSTKNQAESTQSQLSSAQEQSEEAKKQQQLNQQLLSVYEAFDEELQEEEQEYKEAKENYEDKTRMAPANLAKAKADLETQKAQLTKLQISYEQQKITAKAVYDQTIASCDLAAKTYQTQLDKIEEELNTYEDTKDETADAKTYFDTYLGDGVFRTSSAGEVMMVMLDQGSYLTGGQGVMAYTDAESISVSVSVDQSDIAKLSVGDPAVIMLDGQDTFTGSIAAIDPVSQSESRSSVYYNVTVLLDGDVSALSENLTATVIFNMEENNHADMDQMQRKTENE